MQINSVSNFLPLYLVVQHDFELLYLLNIHDLFLPSFHEIVLVNILHPNEKITNHKNIKIIVVIKMIANTYMMIFRRFEAELQLSWERFCILLTFIKTKNTGI
jgi:uncharacterized protein YhhL (DUF1145 family)